MDKLQVGNIRNLLYRRPFRSQCWSIDL